MPRIEVDELAIDGSNFDKLTRRGISIEQLYQVIDGAYVVRLNRAERAASHLLIGRDYGGRCITIPIVSTVNPRRWRPITA